MYMYIHTYLTQNKICCRLAAMDSLHVTSQQTSSKTSSRSASPCRQRGEGHHVPSHHTKTLSHGSVDSAKVIILRIYI